MVREWCFRFWFIDGATYQVMVVVLRLGRCGSVCVEGEEDTNRIQSHMQFVLFMEWNLLRQICPWLYCKDYIEGLPVG